MRNQSWRFQAESYDFQCQLQPRYSDLDTWRHVNNVGAYLLHLEARMRQQLSVLGRQGWFSDAEALRPQRVTISYLQETHYPDPVECGLRVLEVDDWGYRLAIGLFQHGRCVSVQDCLMAAWQDGERVPLPLQVRSGFAAACSPREGAPAVSGKPAAVRSEAYPIRGELQARYADLDPDGLFGEAAVGRCMEQSRGTLMQAVGLGDLEVLLASVELTFLSFRPVRDCLQLSVGVGRVGNSSFEVDSLAAAGGSGLAAAKSVLVLVGADNRPRPIAEATRERMVRHLTGGMAESI